MAKKTLLARSSKTSASVTVVCDFDSGCKMAFQIQPVLSTFPFPAIKEEADRSTTTLKICSPRTQYWEKTQSHLLDAFVKLYQRLLKVQGGGVLGLVTNWSESRKDGLHPCPATLDHAVLVTICRVEIGHRTHCADASGASGRACVGVRCVLDPMRLCQRLFTESWA